MANICTNLLYCRTEYESDLKKVEIFLEKHFEGYQQTYVDSLEAKFESCWVYPEVKMNRLMATLEHKGELLYACSLVLSGRRICLLACFQEWHMGHQIINL